MDSRALTERLCGCMFCPNQRRWGRGGGGGGGMYGLLGVEEWWRWCDVDALVLGVPGGGGMDGADGRREDVEVV